jgi:hypothetical protein
LATNQAFAHTKRYDTAISFDIVGEDRASGQISSSQTRCVASRTVTITRVSEPSETFDVIADESGQFIVVHAFVPEEPYVATITKHVFKRSARHKHVCKGATSATDSVGVFYVSTSGNDANPGTKTLPVATVGEGITKASAADAPLVRVAEGTYNESFTLARNVSVYGGFDATTWTRDVAANLTIIENTSDVGVHAPNTVFRSTVLDGFTIRAVAASGFVEPPSRAVFLEGGPIVSNNRIVAADLAVSGKHSFAVYAFGALDAALLTNNVITAGDSVNAASWAVFAEHSNIDLDQNLINADPAAVASCDGAGWCGGVFMRDSRGTLTNNIVFGVDAVHGSAAMMIGQGNSSPFVNGNYLDGGGGSALVSTSISAAAAVAPSIAPLGQLRNNILLGGVSKQRFGVLEGATGQPQTGRPHTLTNNDLFFRAAAGTTDVLYRSWDGSAVTDMTSIAGVNALAFADDNISADPLSSPVTTFHLADGSPCIGAGTSVDAPAVDLDGEARPLGSAYDIGPDERV